MHRANPGANSPFLPLLLLWLFQSSYFLVVSSNSQAENFEDTVEESFVEFRFKKTGDSFYRVMMDFDENPYLNVEEVMNRWLEINTECNNDRFYCQGSMPHNNQTFWIDGQQKLFGNSNASEDTPLPENAFILKEDELWLRYDLWHQWLHVTVVWSLDRYALNMQPHFPLKAERKKLRQKSRQRQWEKQRKQERIAQLPVLVPDELFAAQFRYNLSYADNSEGDNLVSSNYDFGADIARGHLILSGSYSNDETGFDALNYGRYQQKNRPHYGLLEIGDTRFESTLLVPSLDLNKAIRVDQTERENGAGSFEFRDRTEPDTEIELTINGFLVDTFFSDNEGNYEIEKRLVASGDRIHLRFFFNDGTEDEKVILIAGDEQLILEKNAWDSRMILGDTELGSFGHLESRFGLLDNFSVAGHVYQIPIALDQKEAVIVSVDVGWRPVNGVSLLLEAAQEEDAASGFFRANVNSWDNQALEIQISSLAEESELISSRLFNYEYPEHISLEHSLRFAPYFLSTRYLYAEEMQIANLKLDHRLTRDINTSFEFERSQPKDADETLDAILALSYQRSESDTFELTRNEREISPGWGLRYRFVGTSKSPWSSGESTTPWRASLVANVLDEGENSYSLSLSWKNNRYLSSNLQVDKEGFSWQLIWQDAIDLNLDSKSKGGRDWQLSRSSWNNFGTGTFTGHIQTPPTANDPAEPIEAVGLRANGIKTNTDQNGRFKLGGLPANQKVVIKLDRNSLDASLAPADEALVVQFRPGTRLSYNPAITWTTGFDGIIATDRPIPPGASLEVLRGNDRSLVATTLIESDGFFLVEGLTSGQFLLRVTGVDDPPATQPLEIPAGVDWISEIEIHWFLQKSE